MQPQFVAGERVVVAKRFLSKITQGDVVIFTDPRTKKPLIKRVKEIKNTACFVLGDNVNESTDSRDFGWIAIDTVVGKVIYPKKVYNS
ncbi:MAG: S26 family signal peptidase [Patescibacteria group bacterium]|nr:S26 family signal peptidase [Patescibacteria group bacterium]MDE2590258.1 S26 family signal peptidase [Patescibacteria group bacterium]